MLEAGAKAAVRSVLSESFRNRVRELYYRLRFTDRAMVEHQFTTAFGRKPDLVDPQSFNEKIQWLKLHWRDELAIKCADKAAAREYVAERVGEHVLTRIFGVYEDVDSIRWDVLPEQFVLKATHGSGWNLICRDREELEWDSVRERVGSWMRANHFWKTREWVYKDIPPRVLVEELLKSDDGSVPWDYKVFCFHGTPEYIEVDIDRFGVHRRNIYGVDWQLLPVSIKHPRDPSVVPPKPPLEAMLEYSSALAEPFPHVRVDWFVLEEELRFGEMTFFHGMGRERFDPPEWDLEFGKHLDLSLVK